MGGRRAWVAGIISFVAMGAVLAPTAPVPRAEAAPSGFVTSNGDGLVLDDAPYRFTGINIYNANNTGGCWDAMSDATLGTSLDAIGSGRVIRAWFFQPLATNGGARDWTSFDRTLAFAANRGMKVIPTLGNQWGACDGANGGPGLDKNEAWYSGGYATSTQPGSTVAYRDWVAEIVTRYAADPTVLAWQLMNEAEVKPVVGDGLPCSTGAANILRDFAEDVSGLVKTIDPDHLVSLGTIGGGQCGTSFEEYAFVHDLPTIDVCEYHDYDAPNQSFPGDEFNGLAKRVAQCDTLNKPLIIGESGIRPTAAGGSLVDRADAFRIKLGDQLAAGIDGVVLWAWNPAGSTLDDYDIGPGDPVLTVLASVLTPPPAASGYPITAGDYHSCALTDGGGVKCWGNNGQGALGDGTGIDKSTPVDVSGLVSGISAIAGGGNHSCALTDGGGVKCWGFNSVGQLGDGTTLDRLTPVEVSGLASGISAITGGVNHSCALTDGGGVKCWGNNVQGALGDGTTINRLTPVDVSGLASGVIAIAGGGNHSCALMAAGGVKCWGFNAVGELGDGTTTNRSTSVNVSGLASGVTAIAGGDDHSCALTDGGGVKCWGNNPVGQVGDGTTDNRLMPVDVSGLTSGVTVIAAGGNHSCALTTAGGAKCWGFNSGGQLGNGTTTSELTPGDVSGLASGVTAIAGGQEHSCALTTAGDAKCWGTNTHGQVGDGTNINRSTPVDVVMAPVSPAGDLNETVGGGETITTDPDGLGASPAVPVQTEIVVPTGVSGQITVTQQALGSPPAGFMFFGTALALTGPTAPSAASPYVVTFSIDSSVLGGIDPADLQVFRNGTPLPDCTGGSAAAPDPCVTARGAVTGGSGDLFIAIRTTQFSVWNLGRRAFSVSSASPNAQARGVSHVAVAITGTGFVTGSTALFPGGGVTVHSTTFVDAAHLTADISIANAAALGARDVRVTKPGSPVTNATCVGCFTVSAKPTITSLSPNARPQGASNQAVTFTGTGFASNAVVTFEGTGITINSVSGGGTSLVVNVSVSESAAVGLRDVTVTNPDGGVVTKANGFTVSAVPTLTSTVPGVALQGRTLNVQVVGTGYPSNFTTGGTVSFGPSITVNTVTRNSATKLTVNVTIGAAAALGPRDVSVTNPDGAFVTCSSCFTVTAPPTVGSLAPSSRGQGVSHQLIVVIGTGFQLGVKASIVGGGVTTHSVTVTSATSLTLDVSVAGAAAVGTRDVVVTNPDTGTVTCVGCFTVNPKPTIANTSPNTRPAGASYTIAVNGTSFQTGAAVSFSGTGIQVNSVIGSGTTLTVNIAIASNATIGNRNVTVTNPDGGAATKTNGFKVLAGA